ncbi:hypothetical protein GCM10027040_31030 [Halomonas shantousis]
MHTTEGDVSHGKFMSCLASADNRIASIASRPEIVLSQDTARNETDVPHMEKFLTMKRHE